MDLFTKKKDHKLRRLFNNVLSQVISSSGKFLFAGNRFGDIFCVRIGQLVHCDDDEVREENGKIQIFSQKDQTEINCLSFHRNFLIVGTVGVIYGLEWDEEKALLSSDRKWEIIMPVHPDGIIIPEVNDMWLNARNDRLFAACGNVTHQISLEDGKLMRQFCGHTDYIHGVAGQDGLDGGRIFTASEEGSVLIWDVNQKEATGKIEPHTKAECNRPDFGKWLGAVDVSRDWLICGGGPKLSIWHLPSLSFTRDFDFNGKVHVCKFVEDSIFVAGEYNRAHMHTICGDLEADIAIENTSTYSVIWQEKPIKFMSVAGFSNKLHILKDFRFIENKVELYEKISDNDSDNDCDAGTGDEDYEDFAV